ncbi:Endothelin-converting enzyme 2 [Chionoecetes opilio]|uniref:Endothelin-converting enzyme 2 n=1 Tax=Chionoecetes opilio TaxID=41210 RepID=A0A8J4Y4J8_CHIOP|nr:Endothelin-converting enzyme 2 [Chionoecetes opilio]
MTEATAQQGACREELCLTKECIHAASDLLRSMDNTVDPCDDFYRYACGGWIKDNEHQVAGDNIVYSYIFNVLSQNIDTVLEGLLRTGGSVPQELLQTKPYQDLFLFYERCRKVEQGTQDMAPVHEVLRGLDQFQVGKPFDPSSWDLTRALLQLFRINGAPLFDIMIDSDVRRDNNFAILITSPRNFGLISRLKSRPLHRSKLRGLQEFLRAGGRRVLFGEMDGEAAVRRAMPGVRAEAWAGVREDLSLRGFQNDAPERLDLDLDPVGNLVLDEDGFKEGDAGATTTPPDEASSSSSSAFFLTPASSPHTSLPTTSFALPSITTTSTTTTSQSTPTHHEPNASPFITSTTSTSSTRVSQSTDPHTDLSPSSTTTTLQEGDTENTSTQDEGKSSKDDMDAKRLESLAATLQDTFPNASASSVPPDGDVHDDLYSEVLTRFLPILQELLPTKREELEIQQSGKQYNNFTISRLNQHCPVIDWSLLLGELLGMAITEDHNIYVHYPDHLTRLCTLLDNTEPWVLHYALLTLYSYDVLQETVYAAEGMDRGVFCLQAVKSVFGEVMSNLYLHHIGNDTLHQIRTALRFPPNASFLPTVIELYRTFRHQLYQLYHAPVQSDDFIWTFTVQPYVVDAFYAADINSIVLPEAFFHSPYHRHHTPHYLNFGSTATSMAHEIFHALDFLGIQFDDQGLLTRPFSEEMLRRLNSTADCYHDLLNDAFYEEVYEYMSQALIAFEIDNVITRNENLADISGLRTAFRAYRRWEERKGEEPRLPALPLNPHQLFFVSAALPYCAVTTQVGNILLMELDEHLPNEMRINAMMKNLPEFAKTFNCSSTSKMFSANTCHLF